MQHDIAQLPDVLRRLSRSLGARPAVSRRWLIVGYGANLTAATVVQDVLATRGISVRCATPEQACLLPDEQLICITRSAANDSVLAYLAEQVAQREAAFADDDALPSPILITAANDVQLPETADIHVLRMPLTPISHAGIPTQSVLAILMALDILGGTPERADLWEAFADRIEQERGQWLERVQRQAQVTELANRVFCLGDAVMERVGACLALTWIQANRQSSFVLPLSYGTNGPIVHLGSSDCVAFLGPAPEQVMQRYRKTAGYTLHLVPHSAYDDTLLQAAEVLVHGQLLALARGGHTFSLYSADQLLP